MTADGRADRRAVGEHRSLVPARLDRLPWHRFHTKVALGLGVTWILDGLEIQIVSQVGNALVNRGMLGLTLADVGRIASVYLVGQVVGALLFGRLTDRLGRRRLFFATLALYLVASGLAAFSPNLTFLLGCRLLAGAGIGAEYTAINSAIDEMIPAYYRGRADIMINGTYWAGALLGAATNILLLNPQMLPVDLGWRVACLVGPVLGLVVLGLRTSIPESPRWLITHDRHAEAEREVDKIENAVARDRDIQFSPIPPSRALTVRGNADTSYRNIARVMLRRARRRSTLGLTMMVTQGVLYNAVFFPQATILTRFYHVYEPVVGYLFFPFAAANLLGALLLAPLFDTVGRRTMIMLTYGVSGALLVVTALLFAAGQLTALTLTVAWCVIFFFASAGASSAYLTISEIFPVEMRAQAISFFALATVLGGAATPSVFSSLVASGRGPLAVGYLVVGLLMGCGALVAWRLGVDAERKSLEELEEPLSETNRAIEPVPHR